MTKGGFEFNRAVNKTILFIGIIFPKSFYIFLSGFFNRLFGFSTPINKTNQSFQTLSRWSNKQVIFIYIYFSCRINFSVITMILDNLLFKQIKNLRRRTNFIYLILHLQLA